MQSTKAIPESVKTLTVSDTIHHWVLLLEESNQQIWPRQQEAFASLRISLVQDAKENDNLLAIFDLLRQSKSKLVKGRIWYCLSTPFWWLKMLLKTTLYTLGKCGKVCIDVLVAMFVHQSLYWLTGVVFVCLFIYHRILYARGHDLGWTVGFALLLAFGISSALTFVLRGIFRSIVVFSEYYRCHVKRHMLL